MAMTRNTVLVVAMVATTFQLFVLVVLGTTFVDEFDLSLFELGLIGSLNTAVGALTAPWTGRLTDRIGPRRSLVIAQIMVAVGFVIMASAPSVAILIVAAVLLGIPQGWGNPATNALIVERVQPDQRGATTGLKQSGVQFGIFLAGATLPTLESSFGWRGAIWMYAGIYGLFALLPLRLPAIVPGFADTTAQTDGDTAGPSPMRAIWLLAAYALLMGTVGGAAARFLAVFAQEEAGMTKFAAGWVVSISGLVGIVARIIAGALAERRFKPLPMLSVLAAIGSAVLLMFMAVLSVGAWLLWPIAVIFAVGHGAWNAVAMLAIIAGVPKADAGRASGIVIFGFLGGLTVGAPIAGLVIDATGSYQPVWFAGFVLSAAAAVLARYAARLAP